MGGQIREGNGLRGMRERLQSLAGAVNLTGAAQGGTILEITLPLAAQSPAQPASRFVGKAEAL